MSLSPARCSSCHCYCRNAPEGLPNHRLVRGIGPNCTMNSLGRHYRDQSDILNPYCDYENCDFFTSGAEYSDLPYPEDITLGPSAPPSSQPNPSQQPDLSLILQMLQKQQEESAKTNSNMAELQRQVNSLLAPTTTASAPVHSAATTMPIFTSVVATSTVSTTTLTSSTPSTNPTHLNPSFVTTHSVQPAPSFTTSITAPNVVANAAASLSSALQSGLGHTHNYGYNGLTMEQLRGIPAINAAGNALLSSSTQNIAPLNPQIWGQIQAQQQNSDQVISSVDQLFKATTVNKQLRAYEFASTGQFPYRSTLKADNCNAITFAYGAIKHLYAAKSGLIRMTDAEFLARLRHLRNVFEIACMSSPLSSFSDPPWQIAREYDSCVISDIESGIKSWENLANGLEPDAIYIAKETVELRNKSKKVLKPKKEEDKPKTDPKKTGCITYNTHRSSEGCLWEHRNKGETCVFKHFCTWCKANRDVEEKHKSLNCVFKDAAE